MLSTRSIVNLIVSLFLLLIWWHIYGILIFAVTGMYTFLSKWDDPVFRKNVSKIVKYFLKTTDLYSVENTIEDISEPIQRSI